MGDGLKFKGRNDRIFLFSDRTCLCFHRGTKGKEKIQRPCLIFAHKAESIRANLTDPVSNINTSNKRILWSDSGGAGGGDVKQRESQTQRWSIGARCRGRSSVPF